MPNVTATDTGFKVDYDPNNPKDVKKHQQKTKEYLTMSKTDMVTLVETLLKGD